MGKIMLSYSRRDEPAVKALVRGFEAARREVWFDHELGGGEVWWDSILEHIRTAPVFVFAVSDASLRSTPCRLELDYAVALGRPVLPVQVGPITNLRLNPIAELQIIGYDPHDARAGFAVLAAADETAQRARPLPDPLPEPPPIPFAYLLSVGRRIEGTDLSIADQATVLEQLRRALGVESDESVIRDILTMLASMRTKPWTTRASDREIAALLYAHAPAARPAGDDPAPRSEPRDAEQDTREWFAQRIEQVVRQQHEDEPPADPFGWRSAAAPPGADPATARGPAGSGPAGSGPATGRPAWDGAGAGGSPAGGPGAGGSGSGGSTSPGSVGSGPMTGRPAWGGPGAGDPAPGGSAWAGGPGAGDQFAGGPGAVVAEPDFWATRAAGAPRAPWALGVLAVLLSVLGGAVSLAYSAQVGTRTRTGDLAGARQAAARAKAWAIAGIIVGVLLGSVLLVSTTG